MTTDEAAREHFSNALAAGLSGSQLETAIDEFEKALALGLPGETEAFARISLASELARKASRESDTEEEMVQLPSWARAEAEYIRGLETDRVGGYGVFADRTNRPLLQRFDLLCSIGGSVHAKQDKSEGIKYLEAMISHCDYLTSSPLLDSLLQLGDLYLEVGDKEQAIATWKRLLAADPVDYVDAEGREAALRSKAQGKIDEVEGIRPQHGGGRSGCALLVAVIAASLVALRFLVQHATG